MSRGMREVSRVSKLVFSVDTDRLVFAVNITAHISVYSPGRCCNIEFHMNNVRCIAAAFSLVRDVVLGVTNWPLVRFRLRRFKKCFAWLVRVSGVKWSSPCT